MVAKTMALGGVPMGSMKAKEVEIVVAIMKAIGFTCGGSLVHAPDWRMYSNGNVADRGATVPVSAPTAPQR